MNSFKDDPDFLRGKTLIFEAIKKKQQTLHFQPDPTNDDKNLLKEFAELRGGDLYFPYLSSGLGKGCLVQLLDGSVKYDMISGIGVHIFGHSHLGILEAAFDGALNDTVMQGHLQQNRNAFDFASLLIKTSKLDHCFFTTSGAMANENALKIAFQKKTPAYRVLAFEHCFMGRTWSLCQLTDKAAYREGIPHNVFVDYIPFFDEKDPEGSTANALKVLKETLKRYPKEHALMAFEMVQGEGGIHPGNQNFFKTLMQELKAADVAILVDEVQTFGRTQELFAFQYFGLEEFVDIVTIGKLSQVCATLFKSSFKPKPGLLSQTFTGSSSAFTTGYYIVQTLLSEGYFGQKGKIATIHKEFVEGFSTLEKKIPGKISGPYGIGAMIAFTILDGSKKVTDDFIQRLFQAGVIGFIAGSNPTRVRFLPPVGALKSTDIKAVLQIIENTLSSF